MKKPIIGQRGLRPAWTSAQRRLCSDYADNQVGLSLHCAPYQFVVMSLRVQGQDVQGCQGFVNKIERMTLCSGSSLGKTKNGIEAGYG